MSEVPSSRTRAKMMFAGKELGLAVEIVRIRHQHRARYRVESGSATLLQGVATTQKACDQRLANLDVKKCGFTEP